MLKIIHLVKVHNLHPLNDPLCTFSLNLFHGQITQTHINQLSPSKRYKMKPSYFIHSSLHIGRRHQKHQSLEALHYNLKKKCLAILLTSFLQFYEWCFCHSNSAYPLTSSRNSFLAYFFFGPIFLRPARVKHPWKIVTNDFL